MRSDHPVLDSSADGRKRQAQLRKDGRLPFLRPDAKSQVTMRYVDGKPHLTDTVVLSTQHRPDQSETPTKMKASFVEEIIRPVLPKEWLKNTKFLINPTARFVIGGPQGTGEGDVEFSVRMGQGRRRVLSGDVSSGGTGRAPPASWRRCVQEAEMFSCLDNLRRRPYRRKVPASAGECRRVPASAGECRRVPASAGGRLGRHE